ncbi:MAG: GntR family transcriptional regulator [Clostridia bacterium]|nr:GntR family transcriptional regulator [Clostridia bacterium]
MNIIIDNKSGSPIYDQIYSQIKGQIINGTLRENELLPSIRGLAKDLKISFITTKRAYEELEREGFIYTVPAKGCYVASKNVELIREENLKLIEEYIEKIATLSAACSLKTEDVVDMVKFIMKEEN